MVREAAAAAAAAAGGVIAATTARRRVRPRRPRTVVESISVAKSAKELIELRDGCD